VEYLLPSCEGKHGMFLEGGYLLQLLINYWLFLFWLQGKMLEEYVYRVLNLRTVIPFWIPLIICLTILCFLPLSWNIHADIWNTQILLKAQNSVNVCHILHLLKEPKTENILKFSLFYLAWTRGGAEWWHEGSWHRLPVVPSSLRQGFHFPDVIFLTKQQGSPTYSF
jgi:hypothetical protein